MRVLRFLLLKSKRMLLKFFIVLLIIIFLIKLIGVQNSILKKQKEIGELEKKVEERINKNTYLKNKIERGVDDEFIETYARENLGMTKLDERIIIDIPK